MLEQIGTYLACFMIGYTVAHWTNNWSRYKILQDQILTLRAEVMLLKIKHERGGDHGHAQMD